jgi:hypothetical protein
MATEMKWKEPYRGVMVRVHVLSSSADDPECKHTMKLLFVASPLSSQN